MQILHTTQIWSEIYKTNKQTLHAVFKLLNQLDYMLHVHSKAFADWVDAELGGGKILFAALFDPSKFSWL